MTKIVLENFRPFYGMQEIDLTTKDEKSLILIKALNDVGKTCLFKAFYWCLYGGSKNENRRFVNRTACAKNDGIMSVELRFTHDVGDYRIKRSLQFNQVKGYSFPKIFDENLDIIKNNKPIPLNDLREGNLYLEAILPRDAVQFFLFDGEDIQKYTQKRPGEDVKKAIEMVLGIKELRNARSDLENIENSLNREHTSLLIKKTKRDREAEEIADMEKEIEDLRENISDLENKISNATDSRDFSDEKLKEFQQIQQKVKDRQKAEENYKTTKKEIEIKEDEQRTFNQKYGFLLFSPLLNELRKHSSSAFPSWKRMAISAILASHSGRCICDRPITEEIQEKFEEMVYQKRDTLLHFLGNEASKILEKYDSKDLERELFDLSADRSNLESSLRSYQALKEELDEEIGNYKEISEEIRLYEDNRRRSDDDIKRYNIEKIRYEIKLEEKISDYRKKKSALSKKMGSDKDILEKENHMDSCRICKEAISYVIDKLVKDNKESVEKLASDIFLKLTNAPRLYEGIEITDEYEIKIKTKGGSIRNVWDQEPSAGQSQIISMSFISALNRYTAREAPVIIDTPIGRLDPIHKETLINYFPKIGPQVIILYQPNELNDKDIKPINGYIISEWELKRDTTEPDISLINRMEES